MKLSVKYQAVIQLDPTMGSVMKCTCQCKAGKIGRCKHAAFLFRLWMDDSTDESVRFVELN